MLELNFHFRECSSALDARFFHTRCNTIFQCTFAATCATIVSGAIAERCQFNGYIIFAAVMTGVIYPIPTHWAWTEVGWLSTLGVK